MTFEAYLISKKIDQQAFRLGQQAVYDEWMHEFEQLHPKSFTAQKLFLINKIRRQFPLKVEEITPVTTPTSTSTVADVKVAKPSKPIMRPKIN